MSTIMSIDEAATYAKAQRDVGKIVVTTNGAFDLFSAAHVRLLQNAKKQGHVLLIGVNSDASIRSLKGNDRPVVSEKERLEIVAATSGVDGVFLFDDADPREWLKKIRPNVHVNSAEYGDACVESDAVKEIGATLVLVDRVMDVLSTTERIDDIVDRFSK